ncbi:50S ribosomal protein L16 chloroplastic [Bienertia sinuspersici]
MLFRHLNALGSRHDKSRVASNDTKCASRWKNMGTFYSCYSKTRANPYGFGRLIYEISEVAENIARRAIAISASKMPIRAQFII